MVCHQCGLNGNGVNVYPKLTYVQRKQFWEDRNQARREKSNTGPKKGTANAAVAEVADSVSSNDDPTRIKYKRYQHPMSAMGEIDIGMIQVGHLDTGVLEDMNVRVNLLSCGTSNTGKSLS